LKHGQTLTGLLETCANLHSGVVHMPLAET
jgi:hypothetical protein